MFCRQYYISPLSYSSYQHSIAQNKKEVYPYGVEKMRFPRIYLEAVVFGPATHGGIGSISLRIEQGIMIVTEVMRTTKIP